MKKVTGILSFLVAISILLVPTQAFAADAIAQNCSYDTVKWQDNKQSAFLYLNNWGKTPLTAMSRLAGLAYPCTLTGLCNVSANQKSCYGTCTTCNSEDKNCTTNATSCKTTTTYAMANCSNRWGVSLAFANKSWSGKDLGTTPRVSNNQPNHFGTGIVNNPAKGGDWGITGCAHSECGSEIWCLPCNLDKSSACLAKPAGK